MTENLFFAVSSKHLLLTEAPQPWSVLLTPTPLPAPEVTATLVWAVSSEQKLLHSCGDLCGASASYPSL